jgi:hypothetical protein
MSVSLITEARRFARVTLPSVADLVPEPTTLNEAIDVIPYAYCQLIEASGDLMEHAMKHATKDECAILIHLAQAMSERLLVVRQLAESRLQRFVDTEGA